MLQLPAHESATLAERIAAERAIAGRLLAGVNAWQAFMAAPRGGREEIEAQAVYSAWLDSDCCGYPRHPLANAARAMVDNLAAEADALHRKGLGWRLGYWWRDRA